jgi:hypothetical protein
VTFTTAWRGISLGLFLVALAALIHFGADWRWIFVVMAGMSLLNAVGKGRWRWAPHPLLWGAGLTYSYATERVGGWTMALALVGASLIVAFLVSLVPRRPPAPLPPPRPGAGVVLDVDAEKKG